MARSGCAGAPESPLRIAAAAMPSSPRRENEESGTMRRLLAVLFLALFATPSLAAQCGGDFPTFLASMGREAQAAGRFARRDRPGLCRRQPGPGRAVASTAASAAPSARASRNMPRPASPAAVSAARGSACSATPRSLAAHRAALRRAAQCHRGDLGARDRFRHRRHGQAAGGPRGRDPGA